MKIGVQICSEMSDGDKGRVECPHCHSYDIKKDGQYRSYQKYFCKQCKSWFNDKIGTVFHYSHTPLKKWFLALYLYFVLWPGCPTKQISLEVAVPYPRCYRFNRTVMEKLTSSSSILSAATTKLEDEVESDEFYIKAGLKGRTYHEEITKSGRKPRKRGLKPWRGRGTFDKDHPMITCIHQRNGMTCFDVPVKKSLIEIVCNRVRFGSTVFTDEYSAITNWKNTDLHTKVSIIQRRNMQTVLSMLITANVEVIFTRYG